MVTVAGTLDRESSSSYSIIVRASSTDLSSVILDFTIIIGDVNEFAVSQPYDLDESPNTVAELAPTGSSVGITVFARDDDATNNTITYSLTDTAGGRFAIDSVTGVVSVADGQLLDHESAIEYHITARAVSEDGSMATQNFTVIQTVLNDNSPAPGDMQPQEMLEDTEGGGSTETTTSNPLIADSTGLDFESGASDTLTLTVDDGTASSVTEAVSITAVNAAEASAISGSTIQSITDDSSMRDSDLNPVVELWFVGVAMPNEHVEASKAGPPAKAVTDHTQSAESVYSFHDLHRRLDEAIAAHQRSQVLPFFGHADIRTVEIAITSLTVGYVAFLLKGGTLIAGVATSLPAWTTVDILPVLQFSARYTELDEDGDSLESLLRAS